MTDRHNISSLDEGMRAFRLRIEGIRSIDPIAARALHDYFDLVVGHALSNPPVAGRAVTLLLNCIEQLAHLERKSSEPLSPDEAEAAVRIHGGVRRAADALGVSASKVSRARRKVSKEGTDEVGVARATPCP